MFQVTINNLYLIESGHGLLLVVRQLDYFPFSPLPPFLDEDFETETMEDNPISAGLYISLFSR